MSTARERTADDAYEAANDDFPGDVSTATADVGQVSGNDRAYLTKHEKGRTSGTTGGPQVVTDEQADPGMMGMSGDVANSDAQLERDEREAINTSNIIDERTRGAAKPKGTYREPGDEEGLPGRGDTGSSSLRTGGI